MLKDPKTMLPRTVLLITSGYHLYREYLLRQVAQAANVWLFCDEKPTWETPYIRGHTCVDTLDATAMIRAARALPSEACPHGVLCWDELRMVQTAEVALALGLRGAGPEAVRRCRDKHASRRALASEKVPQARSELAASCEEARAIAARIGYPVIVKPRALGASFGVSLVENPAGINEAYLHASTANEEGAPVFDHRVLIEEYLKGPEISIDSVWMDGRLIPLYLARKICGFFPHFEEIGHHVDACDPLLSDTRLLEVLRCAHRAVGYGTGITHTELRLTRHGPKIIEINARLGGDMIPYVGWIANGIDPGRVAVEVACGDPVSSDLKRRRCAAIRFLYPAASGLVESVALDRAALLAAVAAAGLLAKPRQRLILPPDDHVSCRYGYAIVAGTSADECEEALDLAEQAFSLSLASSQVAAVPARV